MPHQEVSGSYLLSKTVLRVLDHLHHSHRGDKVPVEFVNRLRLKSCLFCHLWFLKLRQHTSQCKSRKLKLGQEQTASSSSQIHSFALAQSHVKNLTPSRTSPEASAYPADHTTVSQADVFTRKRSLEDNNSLADKA